MLLDTPSPSVPLVLDLDGTLLHTDTFHEMMASLLLKNPFILLRLPFWFLKGRAYAKARLVEHANINIRTLPYNKTLLSFAQSEAQAGRQLVLATGTDQRLAQDISEHFGIFQSVIGSDGHINMTGPQKAQALLDRFGAAGFDYAGDSPIDLAVWKVSRKALVVCPKQGVLKRAIDLKSSENIHYIPADKKPIALFFRALRPFFWICNGVLLSPLLFGGLSLMSSGLLILGDLLHLEKERKNGFAKSIFAEGYLHLNTAFMLILSLISVAVFLFASEGMIVYGGAYALLFMTLDRVTRSQLPLVRWLAIALFQISFALFLGIKSGVSTFLF